MKTSNQSIEHLEHEEPSLKFKWVLLNSWLSTKAVLALFFNSNACSNTFYPTNTPLCSCPFMQKVLLRFSIYFPKCEWISIQLPLCQLLIISTDVEFDLFSSIFISQECSLAICYCCQPLKWQNVRCANEKSLVNKINHIISLMDFIILGCINDSVCQAASIVSPTVRCRKSIGTPI